MKSTQAIQMLTLSEDRRKVALVDLGEWGCRSGGNSRSLAAAIHPDDTALGSERGYRYSDLI
jgi:hypothetical protein